MRNTDEKTCRDILLYVKTELENKQHALNDKRARKMHVEKETTAIQNGINKLKIVESFFKRT